MSVSKLHRETILEQNGQADPPVLEEGTGAFWVGAESGGNPTLPMFTDSDGVSHQLGTGGYPYRIEPWDLLVTDVATVRTWDLAQHLPADPTDGQTRYFAIKIRFAHVANSVWKVLEGNLLCSAMYLESNAAWNVYTNTSDPEVVPLTNLVGDPALPDYAITCELLQPNAEGTEFSLSFTCGNHYYTGDHRLTGWIEIIPQVPPYET
jgi:hypothetical protein